MIMNEQSSDSCHENYKTSKVLILHKQIVNNFNIPEISLINKSLCRMADVSIIN